MSEVVENTMRDRLVQCESDISHICGDLAAVRSEVKEIRQELHGLNGRVSDLRVDMLKLKLWSVGMQAAMLGVMARGFHWL